MAKNHAQLNPMAAANALAATGVLFHFVCVSLFGFSRPAYLMMMGWQSTVNSNYLPTTMMGGWFGGGLTGLIVMGVVSWLAGYIFARFYNWFLTRA